MAEKGVFVKDEAKLSVEISDGCEWCDGLGKILFKGVFVHFTDRAELRSYRLDGRQVWECQADIVRQCGQI